MKALNLHGVGDLRYEAVSRPVPGEGEVLMAIRAVGICGSDIPRVYDKGTYKFPTIIGHEFAGEIVAAEDTSLIGRGAAVFPLIPCGKCIACRSEHYAQCADYDYYGSRRDGAMAEFLAVKQNNLCFMPEGVPYEEAAMTEPAAVARHALNKSGIKPGGTLIIYGTGTIGIIVGQWARAVGVKNIVLAARTEDKVDFARKLGFSLAVNVCTTDMIKFIGELTDGQGADVCIEGTGQSRGLADCILAVKNHGTVLSLGNPVGDMRLTQDVYWKILRKEICLIGTWNSSFAQYENDWQESLRAMQDGTLDLKRLITHRFTLNEYKTAFSLMRERREMFVKVMFEI